MNRTCYRFYGGLLVSQEKWLNQMAHSGWRLEHTAKMKYTFSPCEPGQYQYKVEYIGQMSQRSAGDYKHFLEDCGYRVFFKNINLNYSVGKVEFRPWAEKGGKIATSATTLHRELLIVEKEKDGKPFELHTAYEDRQRYYRAMRRPWLFLLVVSAALGLILRSAVWAVFGVIALAAVLMWQHELAELKKEGIRREW